LTSTSRLTAWQRLRWNLKQRHLRKLQKGDEKDGIYKQIT
jgi:hypothetical protein